MMRRKMPKDANDAFSQITGSMGWEPSSTMSHLRTPASTAYGVVQSTKKKEPRQNSLAKTPEDSVKTDVEGKSVSSPSEDEHPVRRSRSGRVIKKRKDDGLGQSSWDYNVMRGLRTQHHALGKKRKKDGTYGGKKKQVGPVPTPEEVEAKLAIWTPKLKTYLKEIRERLRKRPQFLSKTPNDSGSSASTDKPADSGESSSEPTTMPLHILAKKVHGSTLTLLKLAEELQQKFPAPGGAQYFVEQITKVAKRECFGVVQKLDAEKANVNKETCALWRWVVLDVSILSLSYPERMLDSSLKKEIAARSKLATDAKRILNMLTSDPPGTVAAITAAESTHEQNLNKMILAEAALKAKHELKRKAKAEEEAKKAKLKEERAERLRKEKEMREEKKRREAEEKERLAKERLERETLTEEMIPDLIRAAHGQT